MKALGPSFMGRSRGDCCSSASGQVAPGWGTGGLPTSKTVLPFAQLPPETWKSIHKAMPRSSSWGNGHENHQQQNQVSFNFTKYLISVFPLHWHPDQSVCFSVLRMWTFWTNNWKTGLGEYSTYPDNFQPGSTRDLYVSCEQILLILKQGMFPHSPCQFWDAIPHLYLILLLLSAKVWCFHCWRCVLISMQVIQAVFFGICVLTDLSSLLTKGNDSQEQERQLKKLISLRDWMMAVLAFPIGVVSVVLICAHLHRLDEWWCLLVVFCLEGFCISSHETTEKENHGRGDFTTLYLSQV